MKKFKVSPNEREDQPFFAFRSVYRTASKPASYYNMRPPRMDTAQLALVRQPFDHPDFLFELKHDGFRALAHIWDGQCELVSRKRNAYKSFEQLRDNLAKLKVKNAVIDGDWSAWIPKDAAYLMSCFSEGDARLSMPLICCI